MRDSLLAGDSAIGWQTMLSFLDEQDAAGQVHFLYSLPEVYWGPFPGLDHPVETF
jgi:hypothetical protein